MDDEISCDASEIFDVDGFDSDALQRIRDFWESIDACPTLVSLQILTEVSGFVQVIEAPDEAVLRGVVDDRRQCLRCRSVSTTRGTGRGRRRRQ